MKKILNRVGEIAASILLLICVILALPWFLLFLLFFMPVDYIRYKRSAYYKKERSKYRLFASIRQELKVCDEIIKNDLPIKFIKNPEEKDPLCGKFVLGHTLVILNYFSWEYEEEKEAWFDFIEDDGGRPESMELDALIELELEEGNRFAGEALCTDAVFLIDQKYVEDELERAKEEPRFLVYHKDLGEVLKKFCKSNQH